MSEELENQAVDDISDQPLDTSDSVRESLKSALAEVKEREEVDAVVVKEKPQKSRDESGKFAKKANEVDVRPDLTENLQKTHLNSVEAQNKPINAPQSWNASAKAKWTELPADIQTEIARREDEVHKGFTRMDEERNFGKQLKDVITPYMPIINAEGGNPAAAVRDLLNTAYQLRTVNPQQKGQLIWRIAQQYGADMGVQSPTATYVDPQLQQVQSELSGLRNQMQQREQYQQQQQRAAINSEIDTFASDPANTHFETVKAHMAALLQNGLAKDLKDAYDQAVYARPDIRSTLIAQQQADAEAKRVAGIREKTNAARNASSSIKGAPGGAVPIAKSPDRPLREELRANYRAAIQQ